MSVSPQDLYALGWSLLHFVWQGAVLALLLSAANVLLRRAAPQARYVAASAVLLAMLALPAVTFLLLRVPGASAGDVNGSSVVAGPREPGWLAGEAPRAPRAVSAPAVSTSAIAWSIRARLEPWLPSLVGLWAAGVLLLSVRGVGGWAMVQRLRRTGLREAPAAEETLQRLIAAMRVSAPVRLYESALVQVPTVMGWLRPVVLLPASAITGLTPEQLELILAHELAHIRRRDYLVNLVQTGAETLLFYHPAVWWVSHCMRVEREHCCDDLATAAAGSPVRYARALADLEELCVPGRGDRMPGFTMAATGGSLLSRIARLVAPPREDARAPRGLTAVAALASLALAMGVGSSLVATPQAGTASVSAAPRALVTNPMAGELASPEPVEPTPARQAHPTGARTSGATPEPSSDGRAFPIDRILAMARSGITPEYVDEMDALGYSSLSADQLIALRTQGVGPQFVRELQASGYASLSADQLASLRSQGVSAKFAAELKAQGLKDLSLTGLTALRSQGVSAAFVAELKQAGYDDLTVSQLVALRSQGVSGRYALELKALGYDKLSLTKLIALRSQGVTREYVQGMADLGYRGLELPLLLGLRNQGVTPDFVRGLKETGHEGLTPGMLIELRAHRVTPKYVRDLKAAGLAPLSPEGLVRLRSHGVTPDYVGELKKAGFDDLEVEELVELRSQGVKPGLLQRLRGRQ
jgi:beta-lactamase regulating signal transducer with metallopeptidase domain